MRCSWGTIFAVVVGDPLVVLAEELGADRIWTIGVVGDGKLSRGAREARVILDVGSTGTQGAVALRVGT